MKNLIIILLIIPLFLIAQKKKDTLFIKYDSNLLIRGQNPITKEIYYLIKDSKNESGYISFREKNIYTNLIISSKKHCLKDIILKARAYNDKEQTDLSDDKLFDYFYRDDFDVYFLVKDDKYIEVGIMYAIE
jgi:hypothetical protein